MDLKDIVLELPNKPSELDQLKTQLAVYKEDMAKGAEKIAELGEKLSNCEKLLFEWKIQGMKGSSDYARGGLHARQDCEEALEKALRGES